MLACTALVGCTSDDDVLDNELDKNVDSKAYMAIKFVSSGNYGSRAGDGGFNAESEKERIINPDNSIFLFYDEQNRWVTAGEVVTQTESGEHIITDGDHPTHVNDKINSACITLSGTDAGIKSITQVLTVINYDNINSLKQLSLNEALDKISKADPNGNTSGFLMSTSVYVDNGSVKNTTIIDATKNFHETQADALKDGNPVVIHVERAAVKVEVSVDDDIDITEKGEGSPETDEGDITVDDQLKKASLKIKGWKLNNVNPNTYLVKKVDRWSSENPFNNWNYPANFRSYWAESTNWNMANGNNVADADKYGAVLKAYTYNEAAESTDEIQYGWEQTVSNPNFTGDRTTEIPYPNVTTVLIAAEFTFAGDEDGTDYFRYNGIYFSQANYINLILKQLQGVYAIDNGGVKSDLTSEQITLEPKVVEGKLADVQFEVTLAEGVAPVRIDGTTETVSATTIATYINSLDYVTKVEGYKDGACYYQIPIEHLHSTSELPAYGVVRNHWYKLTISAAKHIGEAVYNPNVEIPQIPGKDTEYYLATELHVLNWHVVNQDVTLE